MTGCRGVCWPKTYGVLRDGFHVVRIPVTNHVLLRLIENMESTLIKLFFQVDGQKTLQVILVYVHP